MNGLVYHHLGEPEVRASMLQAWEEEREELQASGNAHECYGRDLTTAGWDAFLTAMPEALQSHTDVWLAEQMLNPEHWQPERWDKRGRWVKYNKDQALELLCSGEFNIAYIRGLARVLQAEGCNECEVYRAGSALEQRRECSEWEGLQFPVQQVLDGHRARYWPPPGDRKAWSLPTGPGCHHSICRVGASSG